MKWGKYNGERIRDIRVSYIQWCLRELVEKKVNGCYELVYCSERSTDPVALFEERIS